MKKNNIFKLLIAFVFALILSTNVYAAEIKGDLDGDGEVNEVDAQQILDVSVGILSVNDLAVPEAINVPGGNPSALEVNAQLVLDYSVATVKPWDSKKVAFPL